MPRFIEEFYYGNIDPQARSTKENKTVQKQMEILMKNEFIFVHLITITLNVFSNFEKWHRKQPY